MNNSTAIMQYNLRNKGFTAATSKRAATMLIKWAETKGIKTRTEIVGGRIFVVAEED